MGENVINAEARFRKQQPHEAEAKLRNLERMKLLEINNRLREEARGKRPLLRFDQLGDRLQAGANLTSLKNKLIVHGQMKLVEDKLYEVGWKDPRKLYRFLVQDGTIFPDQSTLAAKRMTARVKKYLDVAKVIAEIGNFDCDEAQAGVLRDTVLWNQWGRPQRNDSSPQADEAAAKLALLLNTLAARVVRDTALDKLFARMRRTPGRWDIGTGQFLTGTNWISGSPASACLFQTAYQESYDHWTEAPPLPSVPLVRLLHGRLRLPVRISEKGAEEPFDQHQLNTIRSPVGNEGEIFNAEFRFYREIRLTLAPTVNAATVGALFESRPYTEISLLDEEYNRSGQTNPGHFSFFSDSSVFIGGLWRRMCITIDDFDAAEDDGDNILFWDHFPLAQDPCHYENHYLSWMPVTPEYVAHWLDRTETDPPSQPVEMLPGISDAKLVSETWYPRPYFASSVEAAIRNGLLAKCLRSEIERVASAFERHEEAFKNRMRECTADELASLDSDLVASSTLVAEGKHDL